MKALLLPSACLCLLSSGAGQSAGAATGDGVVITKLEGKLRVEIGGKHFTDYNFEGAPRPYLYPILTADGRGLTRNWPMKEVEGEERDHVHHRGLWFGHRHVNGYSFWEETGRQGTIKMVELKEVRSGRDVGIIRARSEWHSKEGEFVASDETTIRIHDTHNDQTRMLDYEITITAPKDKELVFGDDKDAAMAIRVAESMRLTKMREKGQKKGQPGEGHIVLSTGVKDAEAWGKRAPWCDYHGPVDGRVVGVAIFDHPSNPRHPTWWHVRDYGLFAANPFGKRHFEKLDDKAAGEMKLAPGESVTFRYRFYWHEGDEIQGKVARQYDAYANQKKPSTK